jgi:hypothetical protein
MYDALGEDGYKLHRELSDLGESSMLGTSKLDWNEVLAELGVEASQLSPKSSQLSDERTSHPACTCELNANSELLPPSSESDEVHLPPTPPQPSLENSLKDESHKQAGLVLGAFFRKLIPLRKGAQASRDTDTIPESSERKSEGSGDEHSSAVEGSPRKASGTIETRSPGDYFLGLLEYGAETVSNNPRDLAAFSCLYTLLAHIADRERFHYLPASAHESLKSRNRIIETARMCLVRCLALSIQATSSGMIGWLEYGSQQVTHLAERPCRLLHDLACCYARQGMWKETEDILQAVVLRCEQQFPLYHPFTLVSMLDLAATASMRGDRRFARNLVSKASRRLAYYLREMEDESMAKLDELVSSDRGDNSVFRFDQGVHATSHVEGFVHVLQNVSTSDLLTTLGRENEVVFIKQSMLADSLAVLANCRTAAESLWPHSIDSTTTNECWRLALT